MLSNITNCSQALFLALLLLLIIGCDDSRSSSDKSWDIFTDAIQKEKAISLKEVGIDELKNRFSKHFESMQEVVRACNDYRELRRVGKLENDVSYYERLSNSDAINRSVTNIQKKLSDMGASSVSCGRRGDFENNPLSIVSFVMSATGLSVSGSSKGIIYKTEWSFKNSPVTEQILESRGYIPLDVHGWYIYET